MEKLKERLNTLRTEADEANVRADGAEQDLKRSEQQIANKEHELTSVKNKVVLLEGDLARAESRIQQLHKFSGGNNSNKRPSQTQQQALLASDPDTLNKKIEDLEQSIDNQENRLKQLNDQIREFEVTAETNERRAAQLESETHLLRQKYEEAKKQYEATKAELDHTLKQMEDF
ncbi:hypothetical protein MP228_001078 [Amoeboaphelidium protococcarum]|nr:hypothetical protein MP228_001078 [Amoeboaphelidium protococcarum]